jgi:cell wall-associated NlpC family hydrolase
VPPAARTAGISGLAVGLVVVGGVVGYAGLVGMPVVDVMRALLSGRVPTTPPQTQSIDQARADVVEGLAAAQQRGAQAEVLQGNATRERPSATGVAEGGTATGAQVAQAAARYLGLPYRFGSAGPDAFDCSGLVTWVLHRDMGIQLPSNRHTVSGQFFVWSGARTLPRDQCAAGDLVCWTGHIGIATSRTDMIHAPGAGRPVQRSRIWGTPAPTIRRPIAYGG